MPRVARFRSSLLVRACLAAVLLATWWCHSSVSTSAFLVTRTRCDAKTGRTSDERRYLTARRSSVVDSVENNVKTVANTLDAFFEGYPKPPVLPMYRTFLVDLMTQAHLSVVDSRFKYNAIFGLGLKKAFGGLMGTYDKTMGGQPETEKIWKAMVEALGLSMETVDSDAAAMESYASTTSPADILAHMEGSSESVASEAFNTIKSSLYSLNVGIGIFQMMEMSKVDVKKENVEEWAKALKIRPAKITADLEVYKMNRKKLQAAEEMIREVEIREKKKLAERLEAKAKALAEKAKASTQTSEGEAKTESADTTK